MASSRGLKPFVTKFHGKAQLTSTEFMEVFRKYDRDGKFVLVRVHTSKTAFSLCLQVLDRTVASTRKSPLTVFYLSPFEGA